MSSKKETQELALASGKPVAVSMNAGAKALRELTKAYNAAIKSAAKQAAEAKSSASSGSPSEPKET